MAAALHLDPESQVWNEGLLAWVPATTVDALVFPPREPLPPPLPTAEASNPRYGRLYRSSDQRMVLGVCAGLAHKWNISVTPLRVAVVMLLPLLMGWAYFLGAFLPAVPTKPSEPKNPGTPGESVYAMQMTAE